MDCAGQFECYLKNRSLPLFAVGLELVCNGLVVDVTPEEVVKILSYVSMLKES
jgi:hypothetical protein